tara:strand:+ start:1581 stop:1808 length:228 start_codon:yes stop_codon:yes gene_type:complete
MAKLFIIYTKDSCNFCTKAKDFLHMKGEPFMEINVGEDMVARNKLKNKGFKTVPQIFYSDGKHYGDYQTLESKYV